MGAAESIFYPFDKHKLTNRSIQRSNLCDSLITYAKIEQFFFNRFNFFSPFHLVVGSPEMAFVHAMAAAATASFIARACRDGQLSTCGCSRSTRPRQLHSEWTWGGCGDDLEFGYK